MVVAVAIFFCFFINIDHKALLYASLASKVGEIIFELLYKQFYMRLKWLHHNDLIYNIVIIYSQSSAYCTYF